jgi:hypothetical protein
MGEHQQQVDHNQPQLQHRLKGKLSFYKLKIRIHTASGAKNCLNGTNVFPYGMILER